MGSGNSTDNSSKVQLYDFYKYNPVSNTWTELPDYPDNISNFFVGYFASVNGRPFAGLSNTNPVMRELVNGSWISRIGNEDLMRNTGTAAFSIGNSIFIIAGFYLDGSSSRRVWEYNTVSNTWIRRSDFPGTTRHVAISFSIGPFGYYGCGRGCDSNTQYKDMWKYDRANDKWIRIEDFPGGNRSHTISVSDGTYGYAGLGIYMPTTTYLKDFWRYNPE
jgi:N-acetylneuraminic acid mutarotase